MWRDLFVMRRREAIMTGVFAFPVVLSLLTMLGFACGVSIGKAHALVALACALGAAYGLCPVKRWGDLLWALSIIIFSILLSGVFVMYTNADAEAYHRPAAVLLANGWNPLQITEPTELVDIVGGGRRPWCVAFIPKMAYVLGAALSKWFGFVESSDALNVLLFLASLVFVFDWLAGFVKNLWLTVVLTLVMCLSPVVVSLMWGGSTDSAWYSAFLVAATCAGRKLYLPMVLSMLVMSGVKFTGLVVSALIFAAYGLAALIGDRKEIGRLVIIGILTCVMMFLVNASPYITSSINHGGPFYPSHSFVKSERFADDKNPITYDVMLMNDDARQVGWAGRFAWGYVSQNLVKWYYGKKLDKPDFNPDFQVSGGVGGYGALFRFFFVAALLLWPFVRHRDINILAGMILFSVLIQPTIYSGYARYVPQFYLFPILIGIGLLARGEKKWHIWCSVPALVIFMLAINAKSFASIPLQWLISVQNLQVIYAVNASSQSVLWAASPYSQSSLARDCADKLVLVKEECDPLTQNKVAVGSYFRFYKVWLNDRPEDWYDLAHVASGNNPQIQASRNANNIRFFLNEFLPNEIGRIPRRIRQWCSLRARQFKSSIWEGT